MDIKRSVFLVGLILSLVACESPQKNKELLYSGGGAVLGAGSASIMNASKAMTLLATILGGSLGYYLSLPDPQSTVIDAVGGQSFQLGDTIMIIVPSDAVFEPASTRLTKNSTKVLKAVTDIVRQYPQKNILITASTSSIGTYQYEDQLSTEQAEKVGHYLTTNGIESRNAYRTMNVAGLGSREPVANILSAKGIYQNRRIQIALYDKNIQKVNS